MNFLNVGLLLMMKLAFFFFNKDDVIRKIGNTNVRKLKRYLKCAEHIEVRTKLRNQFTHSLDRTSSYIFHRINDGKMQADLSNLYPTHPYENIVLVLDDIHKYLHFAKIYIGKLEKFPPVRLGYEK